MTRDMQVPLQRTLADLARVRKARGTLEGSYVSSALRQANINDLFSLLPQTDGVAVLGDADCAQSPMTHRELRELILNLNLDKCAAKHLINRIAQVVMGANGPWVASMQLLMPLPAWPGSVHLPSC